MKRTNRQILSVISAIAFGAVITMGIGCNTEETPLGVTATKSDTAVKTATATGTETKVLKDGTNTVIATVTVTKTVSSTDTGTGTGTSTGECVPTEFKTCVCPNGEAGRLVCGSDRKWPTTCSPITNTATSTGTVSQTAICTINCGGSTGTGTGTGVCLNGQYEPCGTTCPNSQQLNGTRICSNNAWSQCYTVQCGSPVPTNTVTNTSTGTALSDWACQPVGSKMCMNTVWPGAGSYLHVYGGPTNLNNYSLTLTNNGYCYDFAGQPASDVRFSYGACTDTTTAACWAQYGASATNFSSWGRQWIERNFAGSVATYGCRAYWSGSTFQQNAGI